MTEDISRFLEPIFEVYPLLGNYLMHEQHTMPEHHAFTLRSKKKFDSTTK